MKDVVADLLSQVIQGVEQGMRPPPTTIAALRRLNGALARQAKDNGLNPTDYDKPLSFYVEMKHIQQEEGPEHA